MNYLSMSVAEKLVRIILDTQNPTAASEALTIRDKWLTENDLGILQMTDEIRLLLESATISH